MVYDPNLRIIFIFGGQHIDQYLTDLWTYHVDTKVPTQICSNIDTCGGVETFSRRAVIDPSLNEIYM
jgi:muskelin